MPTSFSPPFAPTTHADWLAQVQKDLKDSTIYESLRWHSPEGFTVEPYYTAEDMTPAMTVMSQNGQKSIPGWLNAPAYNSVAGDEKHQNTTLREALLTGADALLLQITDELSLPRLLNGIKLSDTPVFFQLNPGVDASRFMADLRQIAPYQLRGGMLTDAIPPAILTDLMGQSVTSPNFRTIGISSHEFHSAGATATQELAFTLARLTETYAQLHEMGFSVEQLLPKTMVSVSVGTSYFVEMAKLRALRVLIARIWPAATSYPMLIHGQTSTFYEAAATPYTNLLRATTEAMAAVIGGADVLTVRPYDAVLNHSPGEFSHRIARNISTMLKAESYLDKVADPAAGSYYIENLTFQLAEAAWALFQKVQEMGGFTKVVDSGYVHQELNKAYAAKVDAVQNGRVLVGVTKFRHDEVGAEAKPALKQTDVDVTNRRLASEFE
ncbi:methylmalonyl-CoA mutase family protein [Fibrella aquatica]|uniref:methylmalonyl-CoA mutase family protein n=1 Tax=Fibrella aquatica TaxID=3242487 RepID=UPI00352216BE